MFVRVEAVAVGTTSSEHAYTLGRPDAVGAISRTEEMNRAEQICQAVNIPVCVDAEDGWGHHPDDVARTVTDLAAIGASGASFEDWSSDPDMGLYEPSLATEHIIAAVETAAALWRPVRRLRPSRRILLPPARPDDILARLQACATVGADCVRAVVGALNLYRD